MNKILRTLFDCLRRLCAPSAHAAFLIFYFSIPNLCAYSGIPSSGNIQGVYIGGKAPAHFQEGEVGFWEGEVSSMTWQTTDRYWEKAISLVPGNTYYYKYMLKYGTGSVTTVLWEQSDSWHSVYVGYENNVYLDGDFSKPVSAPSVMDNWAGAPSPPQDPVVEVGDGFADITWTAPHMGGVTLMDIAGYLVYLSTDGVQWSNHNDTGTIISPDKTNIRISDLRNNTSYYLRLRSVDRYEYPDIDINSALYPEASADRTFRWAYSQTLVFKPNRQINCRFAVNYPGSDEVFLVLNGRDYSLRRDGENHAARITLTEQETYAYYYKTAWRTDPYGTRSVKVMDINNDGEFLISDIWGIANSDSLPENIIGWKIEAGTANINFSWKTNPEYSGGITVYRSTDSFNWSVLLTTSSSGFVWSGAEIGQKYFFAIGDSEHQSGVQEIDTSSTVTVKTPPTYVIEKMIDQGITADAVAGDIRIALSALYKKENDYAGVYLVLKSSYNLNIAQGSEIDWETNDFLIKRKGVSPGSHLEFYSKFSPAAALETNYVWNLNVFGSSAIYCSEPDVYVTPAEVTRMQGGDFAKVALINFPARALPVKKAYLTIYNREELAVAGKYRELSDKIDEANERVAQISYQQQMSTASIFMFDLRQTDGKKVEKEFRRPVEVTLPYPPGADTANMSAFYLDEENNFWKMVRIGPGFEKPEINASSGTITFRTIHFTVFALMTTAGEADLSNAVIYPNPFKPFDNRFETGSKYSAGDQYSGIHFTKLTSNTKIRIFTIDGVPVRSGLISSAAGTCLWDARNDEGRDVSSGLYLVLAEDPKALGEKKFIGKIAIIR